MLLVTPEQMVQWRSELADYPEVLRALAAIEDCEGDVEDATIGLAIQAGLQPDSNEQWLLALAKQFRPVICELVKQGNGVVSTSDVTRHLASESSCPELLVLPVAIAAGADSYGSFCQGLML
jgi:hypothetical protein